MKPSTTAVGKRWLEKFPDGDRGAAQLLLDSVEIHNHSDIVNSLREQVLSLAEAPQVVSPILLVAIRSMKDFFPSVPASVPPVAYESFDPGAPFAALPGSEAEIGGMIRDLLSIEPGPFLAPTLTLEEVKTLKVRTICLITDYSGSGDQALAFARSFIKNSTIASWMSYHFLNIHVLAFASSPQASKQLGDERHIDFSTQLPAKTANTAGWSGEEREEIERVCKKYADPDDPNGPLGYKDSFGLFLTNVRVPNNLPQILISNSQIHPGPFAGRQVSPEFFHELPSYTPSPSLGTTLRNLGAEDLALELEEETRPVKGLRALAALYLLEYRLAREEVWAMLGLDQEGVEQLRSTLIALKLIDLDDRLTAKGKQELLMAGRRRVSRSRHAHESSSPVRYLPTQLR